MLQMIKNLLNPIGTMYGIYLPNIYHKNQQKMPAPSNQSGCQLKQTLRDGELVTLFRNNLAPKLEGPGVGIPIPYIDPVTSCFHQT